MVDNGNSASSFATCGNDLFFTEFVDYSTGYSSVDHGISDTYVDSGAPVSFSMKFSMNRGLNNE